MLTPPQNKSNRNDEQQQQQQQPLGQALSELHLGARVAPPASPSLAAAVAAAAVVASGGGGTNSNNNNNNVPAPLFAGATPPPAPALDKGEPGTAPAALARGTRQQQLQQRKLQGYQWLP